MDTDLDRYNRQGFLGDDSVSKISSARIALIGAGGGGSHHAQQCAHIGFQNYLIADPQRIELTNTNRVVGATLADVASKVFKTEIADRLIRGLQPNSIVRQFRDNWIAAAEELKSYDLIICALDSIVERDQLERFARQHLIPYIDIGMDVVKTSSGYLIAGQVILSMAGQPCLRCCGLINDQNLAQEAQRYGEAGPQPQVIWANGVLASTAISLAMQILTPWHNDPPQFAYLEYDGNRCTMTPSQRIEFLRDKNCPHYPADQVGDPLFDIREHVGHIEREANEQEIPGTWRDKLHRLLSELLRPRDSNGS